MRAKSKETFFDYGKKEDTRKKVEGCLNSYRVSRRDAVSGPGLADACLALDPV